MLLGAPNIKSKLKRRYIGVETEVGIVSYVCRSQSKMSLVARLHRDLNMCVETQRRDKE